MQVATKFKFLVSTLGLAAFGILLIASGHLLHSQVGKIDVGQLTAEIGTLLLVIGILHLIFEMGLRAEMLREVSKAAFGNARLHDSGLDDCELHSKKVDETEHWSRCSVLRIGVQYSLAFFKEFHQVLEDRCSAGLLTTVTLIRPDGPAARYLQGIKVGHTTIADEFRDIEGLLKQVGAGRKSQVLLRVHDRVLRYSYIATTEFVWIKFFTNSAGFAMVPALRIRSGTPLFEFFSQDIDRLEEHADGITKPVGPP